MSDATRILQSIEQGDPHAAEELLPLVYEELRKLAAAKLAHEKPGQTLQATALVHEAYFRLAQGRRDAAYEQFQLFSEATGNGFSDCDWAKAYLARMKADPNSPNSYRDSAVERKLR